MTFSIVATDGVDVGVAVASKFVAVGAFVPHGGGGGRRRGYSMLC
jgi:uncharacterized Ntn-hydrolase superfamily protein